MSRDWYVMCVCVCVRARVRVLACAFAYLPVFLAPDLCWLNFMCVYVCVCLCVSPSVCVCAVNRSARMDLYSRYGAAVTLMTVFEHWLKTRQEQGRGAATKVRPGTQRLVHNARLVHGARAMQELCSSFRH